MKGTVTYIRETPCRNCGSHEFYSIKRVCRQCCLNTSQAYRNNNKEKCRTSNAKWRKDNAEYLRWYFKARYEFKREVIPAIFAFYFMTGGKA